jgi:O-antigen/teichoic acid export membrane protein
MVKLGIMMSISMIAVYLVEFTVKSYINNYGGIDDVGLYQAGWTLNVSYLGLVFAAMAKDYFPRISEKNANQQLLVNQQAEIALLILCPMILFMLVFLPLGIKLIYSKDFLPIIPMTRLLLVGSLIKSGSWAISFTFLANGDGKTFLKNELGIKCVTLPSYLILYHFFGLIGIGVAYIFNYTVYFILVSIVAYKKYRFYYSKTFWSLLGVIMCFASCCLIISFFAPEKIVYVIGSIVFMLSSLYCLNELNRRINIKEIIIKRK